MDVRLQSGNAKCPIRNALLIFPLKTGIVHNITRQESGERSMTAQDKELFSQLYDRNYKRLLYAAIRIAHNPFTAEELTNEAFTILLTHFDRVRQHPNLPGWLHTVLTNLALDEYKRQSRYVQVPLDSVQNLGCEPAFLSMLDLLPNELSRTDKEILYLRYQLNLNCVDIAEYLHISHEASRARLSRAKRHYAHLLAKERLM